MMSEVAILDDDKARNIPHYVSSISYEDSQNSLGKTYNVLLLRFETGSDYNFINDIASEVLLRCFNCPAIVHKKTTTIGEYLANSLAFVVVTLDSFNIVSVLIPISFLQILHLGFVKFSSFRVFQKPAFKDSGFNFSFFQNILKPQNPAIINRDFNSSFCQRIIE